MCSLKAKFVLYQQPAKEDDFIGRMCAFHTMKTIRLRSYMETVVFNMNNTSLFICEYDETQCVIHGVFNCVCSGYPDYLVNINLVVPEDREQYKNRNTTIRES